MTTEVGLQELYITAAYTASQFESTLPTNQFAIKIVEVVVQRPDFLETWKIYIITGLGVANLIFAVVTTFMFCKKPIQYKEVRAKMPNAIEALRRKADLDLIIFD